MLMNCLIMEKRLKSENLMEGWHLVEHPTSPPPPPPSQTEDVEHWTRAMFIDATKKIQCFNHPTNSRS
ncbi:hypothetical protein LguiB_019694 [Lonicera macranthoides]